MSGVIRTREDLDARAAIGAATLYPDRLKIRIGSASCGLSAGARDVEAAAARAVEKLGLDATVSRTGCIGFCQREPMLDLLVPGGPRVSYGMMNPAKTSNLLESYASSGEANPKLALCRFDSETHVATGEKHIYTTSHQLSP